MKKIIITAIIVIIAGLGVYFIMQNDDNQLTSQPDEQAQEGQQQEETPDIEEFSQGNIVEIPNSNLVWYEIPEMGIRFKVDSEIAGELIYIYENSGAGGRGEGYVKFSSKELSKIPNCDPNNRPLGSILRIKGEPSLYKNESFLNNDEYYLSRNPKQFNDFFIYYEGPQAVCALEDYADEWGNYFRENPKLKVWVGDAVNTAELLN